MRAVRATRCAGCAAAAAAAATATAARGWGVVRQGGRAAASCEQSRWRRAEDWLKIATLWAGVGGGGGRETGRPGREPRRGGGWAEPGGRRGWTRGGSADPSAGEPGGPDAEQRGARGHLGARPRRREGRGRDWGNPGNLLESSGGELRAGPAIVSRGRTGRLRRPGISEAKHAHARRKVLAGRPGRSFRPPVPGLPAAGPRTVRRRRQPLRCAPRRVGGSTAPGLLFERGERSGAVPGASLEMLGV